jgi:hypothetical protein
MKDKLKTTLLCFSIWLKHTLDFQCTITHDLFVCVTFHVITWLLSFIVKIMSFMPMLEYFDLSTQCFTSFDQDCVGARHLKNYYFVITYLLKDEQELSLGCLIRLKRIYNF